MKKIFVLGMALLMVVGFSTVSAADWTAGAGITGSPHDFQSKSYTTEICNVCHTPHNAKTGVADAPLWNHEVTAASFTVYTDTGTLDAADVGQPNGVSKLCLSCHDGTLAIDDFGGTTTGTDTVSGDDLLGTDLSNDHPISFTYDTALAGVDNGLHNPSNTASGLVGYIDNDMLFGAGNDQLECASCHDVHNGPGVTGKLLLKSNAGSALCLTCHAK